MRSNGELAREFAFSHFQTGQVRTRLGIPRHVLDRSEMDTILGTVTEHTIGIAQPVISKLRQDCGIPVIRNALNWTVELQVLSPLLSDQDQDLAARYGYGLARIQAIRRGQQALSNKTLLREMSGLLGVWSDEDLALQHGETSARYASARQRRGTTVCRRAPEAHDDSVR